MVLYNYFVAIWILVIVLFSNKDYQLALANELNRYKVLGVTFILKYNVYENVIFISKLLKVTHKMVKHFFYREAVTGLV